MCNTAPLSFAQQRLWFLHEYEGAHPVYNVPVAWELTGSLDVAALGRGLNEIVRRHESLRTRFQLVDGEPVQVIIDDAPLAIDVVDLRAFPPADRQSELDSRLIEESRRPFDLSCDAMLRAKLYRMTATESVLLLVTHHIVSDGWSMGILFRELLTLYEAFSSGRPSPLEEIPVQYADYAVWQRERIASNAGDATRQSWKRQLGGTAAPLELPTDRPRPARKTFGGDVVRAMFPARLCRALENLARTEGTTLFTALLAAFQVMLRRYCGRDDITLGTPVAGRTQIETEDLIGCFVNMLVLRTDLSGNPTFCELLARVREVTCDACEHQELPFEKLVEELRVPRDRSRNPIFEVAFAEQIAPWAEEKVSGLRLRRREVETQTATFDLTFAFRARPDGLQVTATYNTDLFDRPTIRRMVGHWQMLLEAVAEEPERPIADLPMLTEAEHRQIVVGWNQTARSYPRHAGLHETFEAQVRKTPHAVAVASEGDQLTFRELNARANQVAHHLRSLGVRCGTLVAIGVERSLDMVVGILGILKAGGAYVPLDPDYPRERLAMMLEDARCPILLTQAALASRLPDQVATTLLLDENWPAIARHPDGNLRGAATGDDLAYVIYTSGSTGRPKGTGVPQHAVSRLVRETDYVRLTPDDVVAQASNCSFDAATFEIWGALLNGSRLEIVSQETLVAPRALAAKIETTGINTLFVTTALFNQLVQQAPDVFCGLKHLLFGGEAVNPRYVRKLLESNPPQRLLHVYGPTETTTFATWYLVEHVPEDASTVPIGRPIANTEAYLLDTDMQPVPVGVPGEIYIGGDGVARGYLNLPELTAERFVPSPFDDNPGRRLYKTGDLARFLPDGNIEFLARIDNQVKLRGFRIEPGEIEVALERNPAVGQCHVIAREDTTGEKRLAAYIVAARQPAPTVGELRSFLARTLPHYMIPSAFVLLESLPLTPNGKVDRQALPMPDCARAETERVYLAPRTPVEEQLAAIWADVLQLEKAGISDNFFELGGHSLLAVRLFAQIEEAFGAHLPLATLFTSPTIEQLAGMLQKKQKPPERSSLVAMRGSGAKPPLYFIHGADGHVLKFRTMVDLLPPDQPLYTVVPQGLNGSRLPLSRVEDMAAVYLQDIRILQPDGPYYFGGYSLGGLIALEMAQQLHEQGDKVGLVAMFDTRHPRQRRRSSFTHDWLVRPPRGLRRYLQRLLYRLIYRICLGAGRPVPAFIRDFYFIDSVKRAHANYVPRPYAGRIAYFLAIEEGNCKSISRWRDLARGGVDVYSIACRHVDLFKKESARELAEKLQASLECAQAHFLEPASDGLGQRHLAVDDFDRTTEILSSKR